MEVFFTLDGVSTSDIFPNFNLFAQIFEQSDDSMSVELSTVSEETQCTVTTASPMRAQMQQTETSQNNFSEEELQQHSTPVQSVSNTSLTLLPQLGQEDQSRFPVVSNEEFTELTKKWSAIAHKFWMRF